MLNEIESDTRCINAGLRFIKKSVCTLFDVGTNEGAYIDLFKKISNKNLNIHCFEPNNRVFDSLKKKINEYNIKINNFGLSEFSVELDMYYPENLTVLGSVYNREVFAENKFGNINKMKAKFISLDEYVHGNKIESIDYLKLDTEGHEYKVLLGGKECFKNKIITCGQVEYGGTYKDSNTTLKDIFNFLDNYNYKLYDVETNQFISSLSDIDDYEYKNYFFIDCEKL